MNGFRFAARLLMCSLISAGCGAAEGAPAAPLPAAVDEPKQEPAPTSAPSSEPNASGDPWQACSADADCTVIEVGCCDHCNGGSVLSVSKAHADDALSAYKATGCSGACTERGCAAAEPICKVGVCGHRAGWIVDRATGRPSEIVQPLPKRP
jgi:hypothetical protein